MASYLSRKEDKDDQSILANKRKTTHFLSNWLSHSRPDQDCLVEKNILTGAQPTQVSAPAQSTSIWHRLGSKSTAPPVSEKHQGVFGKSLEALLEESGVPVPLIVLQTTNFLQQRWLDLEGIFRISAGHAELTKLKAMFVCPKTPVSLESHVSDPHAVASLLKLFLRELPVSVVTPTAYSQMVETLKIHGEATLACQAALRKSLLDMPLCHLQTAVVLMQFLGEVVNHQEKNLMTAKNVAIPLGPCLFRKDGDMGFQLECWDSRITELLLQNQNIFLEILADHAVYKEVAISGAVVAGTSSGSGSSREDAKPLVTPLPSAGMAACLPPPLNMMPVKLRPTSGMAVGSLTFEVEGGVLGLVDTKLGQIFQIKVVREGSITFTIFRRYSELQTLDTELREGFGQKDVGGELPRKGMFSSTFTKADMLLIEGYLNRITKIPSVHLFKSFKEFLQLKTRDTDQDRYTVWHVAVLSAAGDTTLGYLRAPTLDISASKEGKESLWLVFPKIFRSASGEVKTKCVLSVALEQFLYRSRLSASVKLDSNFSERACMSQVGGIWSLYKGDLRDPHRIGLKDGSLSTAENCTSIQFRLERAYSSTLEIPE